MLVENSYIIPTPLFPFIGGNMSCQVGFDSSATVTSTAADVISLDMQPMDTSEVAADLDPALVIADIPEDGDLQLLQDELPELPSVATAVTIPALLFDNNSPACIAKTTTQTTITVGAPIPMPTRSHLLGDFHDSLPDKVRITLNQPFGKDNINQSFTADCRLRHVLLPLFKSNFLEGADISQLAIAYRPAFVLRRLLREHANVDFSSLPGYPLGWESETDINEQRVRMITAAFLHFDGCAATVVRFIGGPHVAAHRNTAAILAALTPSVDPPILADVRRIFTTGVPNYINAHSSEENFQAFRRFGNHRSIDAIPVNDVRQTLVKSFKRGYVLVMHPDLIDFIPHMHLTPQGIIDLDHPYKNPRPIFDSSCRPEPWCSAINDWTNKSNEPELVFATAFMMQLIWLWNLRITYPHEEIYVGDNDVSGAFNQNKYNPMLVALHAFLLAGYLVMNTGATFGGNTSPGNFEPLARARQQHAQYLWRTNTGTTLVEQAAKYDIHVKIAPPPTPLEIQSFSPAYTDSINKGVLDVYGNRLPPPYPHHVDDNFYADIGRYIAHTIAASVLALYTILGAPDNLRPDPLSRDKFHAFHNHLRKTVGYMLDSRRMRVSILEYKRDQFLDLLSQWLAMTSFTLQQVATLHGTFESMSRYCAWARPWFFAIQNAMRSILLQRFHYVKRIYRRRRRQEQLEVMMPTAFASRISQILDREQAQLLWHANRHETYPVTPDIRWNLQCVFEHLSDRNNDWGQQIGHIIPRDPTFISLGDASHDAGGGYCDILRFWFQVVWSPEIDRRVRLSKKHCDNIHINSLEYIVVILQYAAVLTRMRQLDTPEKREAFRTGGFPLLPVLLAKTDNTSSKSWTNRLTSTSLRAQALIPIFAAMLEHSPVGINAEHIEGTINLDADFISRPPINHRSLSTFERREQIFRQAPRMRSWDIFVPNPELCLLLSSSLCSGQCLARPVLPKTLGHFVPGDSISYSLPVV